MPWWLGATPPDLAYWWSDVELSPTDGVASADLKENGRKDANYYQVKKEFSDI